MKRVSLQNHVAAKRPGDGSKEDADTELAVPRRGPTPSASDDSAFERLLNEAAKVSSLGRLLSPGTRLCEGRFVIQRRLGEGGMGVVFEALDTRSQVAVALKTLSRVDAAGIYRLKHEFRSLAGVVHPYLLPLYELFADGELWFFSMSLIDGVRFDRFVRARNGNDGTLDEARLRVVLAQLCAGVQAIHDAGKLHRDLKPSNVLVAGTADGPRVAILDFGLTTRRARTGVGSEASAPGATQTFERVVAGTPAYMAPEQASCRRATVASDWYAVGVMLFEALVGRLPFEGEAFEQLLSKQNKPAPPVHSLAPNAPGDLAELCDGLLAIDPVARPIPKVIHRMARSDVDLRTGPSQPSMCTSTGSTSDDATDLDGPNAAPAETFVGRTREISQVETALGDTNAGKPVFVMVGGPSGIGKTTFVEHFLASAKLRGDAVVLGGRCYQRESVPFKGFDGVIDALSRFLVRLPEAEAARLVPRQAQALVRVFPVLGRVPAIAGAPQRRGVPSEGVELRYRAFEALKELLIRLAEERPLILSIDDLQWSDHDSARLLKHLLIPPDPPMLLLVATYRDDEPDAEGLVAVRQALDEHDAKDAVDVRTLELSALSPAESRHLAQQLLPSGEGERVERIAREGGGSPFLIGELARAAHRSETPGDLQSAILARIAALPEIRRAVLHALCIAPRPVTPDLLTRVMQLAEVATELRERMPTGADVSTEVRALASERLAREMAGTNAALSSKGRRIAPYHDRIRETVVEALSNDDRTVWHRRYTTVLEAIEPLDLDALIEHALGSGDPAKGGDYAWRAARQAADAFAFDRAVKLHQTALAHLQLSDVGRAELLVELAQARIGSGRPGDAARTFLEAAELDPSRDQELQRRAGEQFFVNGELAAGADAMRRALANAGIDYDTLTDWVALAPAHAALLERGFVFEANSAAEIDPAQLARLDSLWAAAVGTTWLVPAPMLTIAYLREALEVGEPLYVARGRALLLTSIEAPMDPPGARRRLPEVVAFLEQFDTPMTRGWIALCHGIVSYFSGCDELGLSDLQRAEELLAVPENRGMIRELNMCRMLICAALVFQRGRAAAAEYAIHCRRVADEAGDYFGRMQSRCNLGILFGTLQRDHVRAELELGLELTVGLDQTRLRGLAFTHLAFVEALEGNLDEALQFAWQAVGHSKDRDWSGLWNRFLRSLVLLYGASRDTGGRAAALAQVKHDAAVLARPATFLGQPIKYPILAGLAEFLQGQLRAAAGKREEARELFVAAVSSARSCPVPLNRHIFNCRLGDMIGGAGGAEMRAEGELALRALGWESPRWIAVFAARFEDEP
jgi:serine/threonine protein kinase